MVGLDGATWNLLSRFELDGTMPFLAKLHSRSTWGTLHSCIPAITAPAWTSMVTGMNPGGHGVFDFLSPGASIDNFLPNESSKVRAVNMFEVAARYGRQSVIINLPLSWPPKCDAPTLGHFMTPTSELVFPRNLLDKPIFRRYRSFPRYSHSAHLTRYLEEVRSLEEVRFECGKALFVSPWSIFFIVFNAPDWIQHKLYRQLVEGKNTAEVLLAKEIYADIDRYIEWFNSRLSDNDYLILVSDHGFRVNEMKFKTDAWLASNGYEVRRVAFGSVGFRLDETKGEKWQGKFSQTPEGLDLTRLAKMAGPSVAGRVFKTLMRRGVSITTDPKASVAASCGSTSAIYLNRRSRFKEGTLGETEADRIRSEIVTRLKHYEEHSLFRVLTRSEAYSGLYANLAPDISLVSGKASVYGGGTTPFEQGLDNYHDENGIVLASGPRLNPSRRDAQIYDVFSSVLTALEIPVPEGSDGHSFIGEEVIGKKVEPSQIQTGLSEREEGVIYDRLKSLGYL